MSNPYKASVSPSMLINNICTKLAQSIILACICCVNLSIAYSQDVDSLRQQLQNVPNRSTYLVEINNLAWALRDISPREGIELTHQAFALADSLDNAEQKAKALTTKAITLHKIGIEGDSIVGVAARALSYIQPFEFPRIYITALHARGLGLMKVANYEYAFNAFEEALVIASKYGSEFGEVNSLMNMGAILSQQDRREQALEYYEEGFKKAKDYGQRLAAAGMANNIANYYTDKTNNLDQAEYYYNEALKLLDNKTSLISFALVSCNLAKLYGKYNRMELRDQYFQQGLEMARDLPTSPPNIVCSCFWAESLRKEGKIKPAIELVNSKLEYLEAGTIRINTIRDAYTTLAKSYAEIGDYKNASRYFNKVIEVQDTIFDREKHNSFHKLEVQFRALEKEHENKRLIAQNQNNKIKIRNRNYGLGIGVLILMLMSLAIYLLYVLNKQGKKNRQELETKVTLATADLQKKNKALKIANDEMEQFAYITSHDLKGPLRNISSYSSLLEQHFSKKRKEEIPKEYSYLQYIRGSVQQLNQVIEDILAYIMVRHPRPSAEEVDMDLLLLDLKKDLRNVLEATNGTISYEGLNKLNADSSQLGVILRHLIQNGLTYNKNTMPSVRVTSFEDDNNYYLSVADNGIGIAEHQYEKIFKMFTRSSNQSLGSSSGIGLAICWRIIHAYNGHIKVESSPGEGSIFTCIWPKPSKLTIDAILKSSERD